MRYKMLHYFELMTDAEISMGPAEDLQQGESSLAATGELHHVQP